MGVIALLAGIGFVLVLTEFFLPGGVLGTLGGILLIAAIAVGYVRLGPIGGTTAFCIIGVIALAGFCTGMAIFPQSKMGRRLTLGRTLNTGAGLRRQGPAIGSEGVALTLLRPSGTALIDGRRVDVVTLGEFVEPGTEVLVTAVEGPRIVVCKKA
ncbi:MAG TPA: NfeD family protein [Chthoniobacterales bacterium]